jgi:hypothetical protein
MRKLSFIILSLIVASCVSVQPMSERGNFLTYEHGIGKSAFKAVYNDAAVRCEAKGLVAMQTSSTCPFRCVTNFECVKNKE